MEKNNNTTGVKIDNNHIAVINELQSGDIALMYCDTLNEIATYITMADDPELEADRQLHWLRTIAMIRKDIQHLANN